MPHSTLHLSRIEIVVLARLSGPKQPSETDIAKDLAKLVIPAASPGEWKARLGELLARLRDHGFVDPRRRLTDAGRAALRDALGVTKVPAWGQVRDRLLPAIALGVEPTSKLLGGKDPGERLQAALAAKQLGLTSCATLPKLLDEFVAAELGLPPGKLTMKRIRAHLLERRTGIKARGNPRSVVEQIAASTVRAPNARAASLRTGLVRRWLVDNPAGSNSDVSTVDAGKGRGAGPGPVPRPPDPAIVAPLDDHGFAAVINDAIDAIGPEGRYGPHKVFISAIWRRLAGDPRHRDMSLAELKRRLLDANRASLLSLARADLVAAMDGNEVAASEIFDRGSSFHFVLDSRQLR